MKRIVMGFTVLFTAVFFSVPLIQAQPLELKAVSFLPKDHRLCAMIPKWIDKVNSELRDHLRINWIGGPEVMPPFDQPEAVRKGIFQVGFLPAAYYGGMLPAGDAISLSNHDFTKEREKGGVYDYFNQMHEKINMKILGTWLYDPFYLYVKKPVKGLDDLKGMKMRTAAKYDKMMLELGMIPVTVQFGETYTSLQRGVVDGFGWPTIGPREWGWLEYCKYVVDIPFYTRQNTFMLINLDTWAKLPSPVQEKLIAISAAFEQEMQAYFEKAIESEKKEMEKIGVQRIAFSPEDTEKFIQIANQAFWDDLAKKVSEQDLAAIKRVLGH